MSEQTEPVSTDVALSNLSSALTSIANNDLSVTAPKTAEQPKPAVSSPEPAQTEVKPESKPEAVADTENVQSEREPSEDKAKIRWKELKQAEADLKLAQKELAELKARGGEYEQTAKEVSELKEQIAAIQKEREALDGELYLTRVQATREWKQYVTEPLTKIIEDAEFFAQRNKAETSDLIDALQADSNGDPAKLESLISDWSERDKTKIWAIADNLLQIEKRKAELESNSKAAYEASMERYNKEQEQQYQQYIAERESAVGEVLPKLNEKVFSILPEDKRPDINKLKDEVMRYDEWPENLKVYGVLGATVLPDLIDQITSLQKELAETKENNVKLRGGAPSVAGGNAPKSPAEATRPTDYTKMDEDSFVKSMLSRVAL